MPVILKENNHIIREVCLHHISGKHKNSRCKNCLPNYNPEDPLNNYKCQDYSPQLQITYESFLRELEKRYRKLNEKEMKKIQIFVNVMNCGLIDCNNHKQKINLEDILEGMISDLKENIHLTSK
jgi:PHP family Zn ribbon phosphoesterase